MKDMDRVISRWFSGASDRNGGRARRVHNVQPAAGAPQNGVVPAVLVPQEEEEEEEEAAAALPQED